MPRPRLPPVRGRSRLPPAWRTQGALGVVPGRPEAGVDARAGVALPVAWMCSDHPALRKAALVQRMSQSRLAAAFALGAAGVPFLRRFSLGRRRQSRGVSRPPPSVLAAIARSAPPRAKRRCPRRSPACGSGSQSGVRCLRGGLPGVDRELRHTRRLSPDGAAPAAR